MSLGPIKKGTTDLCLTAKAVGKLGRPPRTFLLQVWSGGSRGSSEKATEFQQAPAEGDLSMEGGEGVGSAWNRLPRLSPST